METLKDIIGYYNAHPDKWLYYQSQGHYNITNVLDTPDDALCFIKWYFQIGGKGEALVEQRLLRKIPRDRFVHTVSVFFLGLRIAECIGINSAVRDTENMSFQYYWFMTCLYHDIGYCYEGTRQCEKVRLLSKRGLAAIRRVFNIQYCDNRMFATRSQEAVDVYLKGRATCGKRCGVIDHGIAGGLILFDGLRKQFEKEWEHRPNRYENRNSFHSRSGLHYSESHSEAYAKAADAIIAHNIWSSTLHEYPGGENINLDKLSASNDLCYVLCIADSIEPLKRMPCLVDKVYFDFGDGCLHISAISDEYSDAFSSVYGNVKSMEDWIEVGVETEENRATITMQIVQEEVDHTNQNHHHF